MRSHKEPLSHPGMENERTLMRLPGRGSIAANSDQGKMEREIKEEVSDFDNLYKAMLSCRKNVMWKDSVSGYVKNGLANTYKLQKSIENGTYKLDKYTTFKIYEPKERDIVSTRFKDRVFQRSLCDNYFYNTMTKSFIYDNCACQEGKGTEFARKRLIRHLQRFYRKRGTGGWILKADLKNFFGSTPHKLAYEAVLKRSDDDWVGAEVKKIIDSFNQGQDPEIGMGLGSEITQIIQLAVLDDFDHFIKEKLRIRHYVRYNDDFILIHEDKEYLQECRIKIRAWMESKGLTLSKKKTQLFRVTQGIKFLGFKFRLTETGKVVMTLLPEKLSHERRKLRKLVKRVKEGHMTKADADKCYRSWKAHVGNDSKKKRTHPGRRARRNCHKLILEMDKFYKELWREDDV